MGSSSTARSRRPSQAAISKRAVSRTATAAPRIRNKASPRCQPSLPLMAKNTRASKGKKMWTRISTPTQRPSGIDQPRILGLYRLGGLAGVNLVRAGQSHDGNEPPKAVVLKGHGFSRAAQCGEIVSALAAEGCSPHTRAFPQRLKPELILLGLRHPSTSSGQALKSCPFKTPTFSEVP